MQITEDKGNISPVLRGLSPVDRVHYDTVVLWNAQLSLLGSRMEFGERTEK